MSERVVAFRADIVIVGGGVNGLLSACELADAGQRVALLERTELGRESSWAGGGILSPLYPWRYVDPITRLAQWSQARYPEFVQALRQETGQDAEWTQSGLLMPGLGAEERQQARDWALQHDYRLEGLSQEQANQLSPGLTVSGGESLWMPDVAQIRNPRLLKALRQAAESAGVQLLEHHPVDGFVVEEGSLKGLRVGGECLPAEQAVICGGAWSGELAARLGLELPIRPVKGQMVLFNSVPGLLSPIVLQDGFYLIPRRDGRVLAGSTLEEAGFDKSCTGEARETLLERAYGILPALKEAEIEMQWAGLRPGTEDGIPFIGAVPGAAGLYVNAGQYRNGVVTGPASARLLRNLVLGEAPIVAPEPYQLPG